MSNEINDTVVRLYPIAPPCLWRHNHIMRIVKAFPVFAKPAVRLVLVVLAGAIMVVTGCVRTLDDSHTGAIWFGRDKFDERFPRSVEQVYAAASAVVTRDGALLSEDIPHDTTNETLCLQARVNNCDVWIKVESVSRGPEVTALVVQARTQHETGNEVLANQLDTEIAIELEHMNDK
jgi:hypothetical protein